MGDAPVPQAIGIEVVERKIRHVCCHCSILESFGDNKCPKVPPGFSCFPLFYIYMSLQIIWLQISKLILWIWLPATFICVSSFMVSNGQWTTNNPCFNIFFMQDLGIIKRPLVAGDQFMVSLWLQFRSWWEHCRTPGPEKTRVISILRQFVEVWRMPQNQGFSRPKALCIWLCIFYKYTYMYGKIKGLSFQLVF